MSDRRGARRTAIVGAVALAAAASLGAFAHVAGATSPPDHKITICHATDSYTNPYVVITVDVASVRFAGHQGHDGPIFFPAIPKHTKWGDIIPPTSDEGTRAVTPKNWTPDGQSILANGCNVPGLATTTTSTTTTLPSQTTTTSGVTTTTGATTTTTAQPGTTTTNPQETTTSAPSTTTTTVAPTSSTTAAPTTTTTEAPSTTTSASSSTTSTTEVATTSTTVGDETTTTAPSTTSTTLGGETTSSTASTTSTTIQDTIVGHGGGETTSSTASTTSTTIQDTSVRHTTTTVVVVAGETAVSTPASTEAAALPRTGSDTLPLLWFGLVSLLSGALLIGRHGRRRRIRS